MKEKELVCPKCESKNINQYRMMTGAIWCDDCGFKAEHKEINNPFIRYKKDQKIKMCEDCGKYPADTPSSLCCGCNSYNDHLGV